MKKIIGDILPSDDSNHCKKHGIYTDERGCPQCLLPFRQGEFSANLRAKAIARANTFIKLMTETPHRQINPTDSELTTLTTLLKQINHGKQTR